MYALRLRPDAFVEVVEMAELRLESTPSPFISLLWRLS